LEGGNIFFYFVKAKEKPEPLQNYMTAEVARSFEIPNSVESEGIL
jgi:hypothetical protein